MTPIVVFRPLLFGDAQNVTQCGDYQSCSACTSSSEFDCSWCATDSNCIDATSNSGSCASQLLGTCNQTYYTIIFLIIIASLLCVCCAFCYFRRLQRLHHEETLQAMLSPLLPQRARELLFRNSKLEGGEAEWMCIICGFDNKPLNQHCTMCGTSHEFSIEYKGKKIEQRKERFHKKQKRDSEKRQQQQQKKKQLEKLQTVLGSNGAATATIGGVDGLEEDGEATTDDPLTVPLLINMEEGNEKEAVISENCDNFDLEKQFQRVASPLKRKTPLKSNRVDIPIADDAQLSSISFSLKLFQPKPSETLCDASMSMQQSQGIEPLSINQRTQALNFRRMNQLSLRQKSARRRKMWQRKFDENQGAVVWMRVPVKDTKVGSAPFGYTPGNSFAESKYEGNSMSYSVLSQNSMEVRPTAMEDLLAAAANPPVPVSPIKGPTYSAIHSTTRRILPSTGSTRQRADSFGDAALVSTSPGFTSVFDEQGDLQWQKVVPGVPMPRSAYGPSVARYPLKFVQTERQVRRLVNPSTPAEPSIEKDTRLGEFLAKDPKFDLAAVAANTFKEKQLWFLDRMSEMQRPWSEGFVRIEIRRAKILEDSHRAWTQLRPEDLHKWVRFQFHNEPGVDAGGLEREWFALVIEEIFSPQAGLFTRCGSEAAGSYHINPISGAINANHLSFFRFVGRTLGKAVMEQQPIKAGLSLPLRKQLISMPVTFSDLEFVDDELYRNLIWLSKNDNVSSLMLDFSISYTAANQTVTYDLIPGGSDIMVTDENKQEYLQLRLRHRLLDSIKMQLENLMLGFYEVVPPELLSVFDYQELDLLLCGVPEIDLDDWIRHTEYLGEYHKKGLSHPVIKWFWEAVRTMSQEERVRLLQFTTGCARLPVQGFKALQSSDGRYRKFNIQSVSKAVSALCYDGFYEPFPNKNCYFHRIPYIRERIHVLTN
jgi:hypothetical protein